ncbi:hypothetical protein LARI1_G001840, partial [Lachnellula arida]
MAGTKRTFDEMARADQPTGLPPKTASSSLLETELWSDLTIKCQEREFRVHKVIVGLQSEPLAAHFKPPFIASAGVVNLPDDESEILANLVQFFYTGDFTIESIQLFDTPPSKVNKNMDVALQSVEEVEVVEGGAVREVGEDYQMERTQIPSEPLITVVKVYIMADKYDVPALKKLATTKYRDLLQTEWESESFSQSLELLFDQTMESDRMLKDVAIAFAGGKAQELMDREDFVSMIKENGDIGAEVFKACLALSKVRAASAPMAQLPNPACVSTIPNHPPTAEQEDRPKTSSQYLYEEPVNDTFADFHFHTQSKRSFDIMSAPSGLSPMTAGLLESGKYSDLTLKTSDGKVYQLHRSVVCLQSKPLAACVDGNFMEANTKTIDLKDDDPYTVDLFIKFLYTADYDVPKMPVTSHDPAVVHTTEPNQLLVHTKVYILAEKYDVPALKVVASNKFQSSLSSCGPSEFFVTSLELMFTQIPENDRILKDLALKFAGKIYRKLADRGDFIAL